MLLGPLPLASFFLLCLPGIALGWSLRWLRHRAELRRDGQVESRYDRFMFLLGTMTQSAAIGLALTFVAILLAATRIDDARLLAGLTFITAIFTGFAAAFLRELIRRLFYTEL